MKFWKDNKLDQQFELDDSAIRQRFLLWGESNPQKIWGWPLDRCLRDFLTAADTDGGLSSVFTEEEYAP